VELLGEQLTEELRDALQLKPAKAKAKKRKGKKQTQQPKAPAAWDVEAMSAALEAGKPAAEIVGANPSWLQGLGSKLLGQRQNKLLPVLLDWVVGMGRLQCEGVETSAACVPLLVTLMGQLQEVWAGAKAGDDKGCCSHRLGSSRDLYSPFMRLCHEGAARVVQGVLAAAEEREAGGSKGVAARLMAPNPLNGKTPLIVASQNGHTAVVAALLTHKATDANQAKTDNGSTPLFVASQKGRTAVVAALLAHEATEANQATTDNGCTPLFVASQNGHTAVVAALLAHDAVQADKTNKQGFSPLMIAAHQGRQECVEVLLAGGADRRITMQGRFTAADCARQEGHYALAALLK
jgi:hypothetical protein